MEFFNTFSNIALAAALLAFALVLIGGVVHAIKRPEKGGEWPEWVVSTFQIGVILCTAAIVAKILIILVIL
jgi:amino acid transporter